MRQIDVTTRIDAPPAVVWEVLADGPRYRDWNPFITSVEGELAPGRRPVLTIAPPGRRPMTFKPVVVQADPGSVLRWRGRLLLPKLFDGEHEFLLTPATDGGTVLVQRERFRGLLVPLLGGVLEPTRQGFEAMNQALRHRAESRAALR